ncbi:MAG: TnsD family transposase [Clostridium sp.]|uniref:TnsD family transposase n=1 Tax=Clostridium sp. TaxID=1506 RepID=UPI003062D5E8
MVHFFTDPYKDELIYSAIARYHYYTGNIDCKDTLEELFNKRTIIPSLEIGSNIDTLAEKLGGKYTSDNILRKNTIFPYYEPFLSNKRSKSLIDKIKHGDGRGIYAKLGMVAGSICSKKNIYYCSYCLKEEIDKTGEAYIHREHQLQGVFICPHHRVTLNKYPVNKSNSSRIEFTRLDSKLVEANEINSFHSNYYEKHMMISKSAYYLLNTDLSNSSKEKVLDRYKNLLYERGLTTASKRIKQQQLYDEFTGFYGNKFLETIQSGIANYDEYNWLKVITRNLSRTVHPLRHILLINFLSEDIESFFNGIKIEFNPFGEGPWPCLNRASDHYRQMVIEDVIITDDYKSRLPVGTFSCECGFVYSRKGPDRLKSDKYKVGRVKQFGHVWMNQLNNYLKEKGHSLRSMARLMNCDTNTVKKYKDLLENESRNEEKDNKNRDFSDEYKAKLLAFIKANPNMARTEIHKLKGKEYSYLYRKDSKWLFDYLPTTILHDKKQSKVVNWEERDKEILELIKSAHKELLGRNKPIRVSKSSIGKVSENLTTLEKNIDKLPRTEEYLNVIVETVEEFQIRRCKKLIDKKIEDDDIKLWQLKRIAGIRDSDFEKIKDKILIYMYEKEGRGVCEKGSS